MKHVSERMALISPILARAFVKATATVVWIAGMANADTAAGIRDAAARVEGHPRLFMDQAAASQLPERAKLDAHHAKLAAMTVAKADGLIDAPVLTRELIGRRMLHVSRHALDRMMTLAMAWHLTGDPRYAERGAAELRAVSRFDDWNPPHFLDTAEMTLGVSIGYDWLHAVLDEETRELARRAIFEKGLTPALKSDRHWWLTTTNNWNQVCNGGLVAGALVLLDHHPEAAHQILERAVRHVPNAMASYAPAGAYPEGPGYWAYGTSYNVVLLALLESALGSTFGLCELEGFAETGAFPLLMTGPSGQMFNFSDGRPARGVQPAVYWLAKKFSRPEWAAHEDVLLGKSSATNWIGSLALLWRDPQGEGAAHNLPLHWTSRNTVPVSVHRNSWQDDGVFVGVKAGPPGASHGQMDIGSFVIDAGGVRWAHDLGMESYHHAESQGITLWHKHQDAGRWQVFRNNNHSHNTLVIDGRLQHAAGDAPIVRFSADLDFPHTVVDMTPVYQEQVAHAHRGIALLPGGNVLVSDHLAGLRPGAEVRWAMVTRADVGETGRADLTLRENGRELELSIHGGEGWHWQSIDISEPRNIWDSPNRGFSMIVFTAIAPPSGELDLRVVLRPGDRQSATLESIHLASPLMWSEP
ncbi:MAG: heparinase II/III family protein [Luteolibacter sp.]